SRARPLTGSDADRETLIVARGQPETDAIGVVKPSLAGLSHPEAVSSASFPVELSSDESAHPAIAPRIAGDATTTIHTARADTRRPKEDADSAGVRPVQAVPSPLAPRMP